MQSTLLKHRSRAAGLCSVGVIAAALIATQPAMAQPEEASTLGTAESSYSILSSKDSGAPFSPQFGSELRRLIDLSAGAPGSSDPARVLNARLGGGPALVPPTARLTPSTVLNPPTPTAPSQTAQGDIAAKARRLQLGVRAGVAFDPELILFGVQSEVGPIVNSNLFFRPSVEFAFGEVTAMFGFNGELIYRLQQSSPQDRWTPYFGGGLGINLLHQNFDLEEGGKRIDFGDFHSDSALNILAGVRSSTGIFLELRTSVYSDPSPTLRLAVGYNF